jgi:pteridine reductase
MSGARRVALVTGGGRRVGAAMARGLSARGYAVAIHYHGSADEAHALAQGLPESRVFQGDLEDSITPSRLIQQVVDAFGRIDLLVNSAATFERTPIESVTPEQWDRAFAVNLRAPFFLSIAAARAMAPGSSIINLSDLAGFETWPGYLPHGLSKGALAEMTRSLAKVLAPAIRVNAIVPGVVLLPEGTPEEESERLARATPLQRHGSPDDIVRAMAYLLDASFVTGEVLFVDGGRHVRR